MSCSLSAVPMPAGGDEQLSGPLQCIQQGKQQTSSLHEAIQLNQARALIRQGSGHEAVKLYRKLEATGRHEVLLLAMSDASLSLLVVSQRVRVESKHKGTVVLPWLAGAIGCTCA